MIDELPEGKSIGWMQAPPQWIFTHTVRFIGIVRVVIQDGEGFILIKKGKPLMYYFKHGRIELRGHAALDYFNSHPTIEFNLCKYTPEEFARALKICDVDESIAEGTAAREQAGAAPEPAEPETATAGEFQEAVPAELSLFEQRPEEIPEEIPAEPEPETPQEPVPEPPETPVPEKPAPVPVMPAAAIPARPAPAPAMPAAAVPVPPPPPAAEMARPAAPIQLRPQTVITDKPLVPQPAVLEDPDIKIIGQIKKLNGIVAISVFNDERNILLMGDVEIEPLLKIARTMLSTTGKITPHLDWGSFVHMTLQIPEGNVIIAPYHDNHLCILTTRTINIGHIRRILRDLQQDRHMGMMM